MHVQRFSDAKPYEAPNHRNYTSLRLFGAEAGGSQALVFGIRISCPAAAPVPTPPRLKKSILCCAAN